MSPANILKGNFLECCDCYTICPCWVKEQPDEDHCNSLYIWTFDEEARIAGEPIGGKYVAAASFFVSRRNKQQEGDSPPAKYGIRNVMQSAIYVDRTLGKSARDALTDAFTGTGKTFIKELEGLSKLLGTVVDRGEAEFKVKRAEENGGSWEVTVEVVSSDLGYTSHLAHAKGMTAKVDDRYNPLKLENTALHSKLGLVEAVEVQEVERFEMAVSPLPGGPFVYSGRAGMKGRFKYNLTASTIDWETPPDDEDASE